LGGTRAGKRAFAPGTLMRYPSTISHMVWEGKPPGRRYEVPFGQISYN